MVNLSNRMDIFLSAHYPVLSTSKNKNKNQRKLKTVIKKGNYLTLFPL